MKPVHEHQRQSEESIQHALKVLVSDKEMHNDHSDSIVRHSRKKYHVLIGVQFVLISLLGGGLFFKVAESDKGEAEKIIATASPSLSTNFVPAIAKSNEYSLSASGVLKAKQVSTVSSEITAKLKRILVSEGDSVLRGETIALLDDELVRFDVAIARQNLKVEQARLISKQARFKLLEADAVRAEALMQKNSIGTRELHEAQTLMRELRADVAMNESLVEVAKVTLSRKQAELDKTKIIAPFDGVVTSLNASEGEIVSPISNGGFTRSGIVTIVSGQNMFGEIWVPERSISKLQEGQKANLVLDAWPEENIAGVINYISPVVDRQRSAVIVHVEILETNLSLSHDMSLEAKF